MKSRSLAAALLLALCTACAGGGTYSMASIEPTLVEKIPTGLDRAQLVQRLGPPFEEYQYPRINQHVVSWRLNEAGATMWMFNAHLDASGKTTEYSRSLDWRALGNDGGSSPDP